jgi:hypothetical protein
LHLMHYLLKAWSKATTRHSRTNKFVLFGGAFNGSPTINVQRHREIDCLRMMDNLLGYEKGDLFIYLALAKPALPGQFILLVSFQSKEKS